ncbi:MAG: TetR family transcriptional regulator [Myxococcales bacterium]|nr:TetR family transcriptional regulator [Myxococcales bacterium]
MSIAPRRIQKPKKRATQRRRGNTRSDNRRDELLAAAARLFSKNGFEATSMRDIANEVGMLAGSMYYHFPAKDDLIVAAHAEGVQELLRAMDTALEGVVGGWERLEAVCVTHLENLLGGSDIAGVVAVDFSQLPEELRARLIEQRDEYEGRLAQLIDALELREGVDRRLVRLSLLGSLNWTPNWFRAEGQSPAAIARHFVALLRDGVC